MHETEFLQLDVPRPYEGPHWRDHVDFGAREDCTPNVQLKPSACDGWKDMIVGQMKLESRFSLLYC